MTGPNARNRSIEDRLEELFGGAAQPSHPDLAETSTEPKSPSNAPGEHPRRPGPDILERACLE
jgi:hypothetical protein